MTTLKRETLIQDTKTPITNGDRIRAMSNEELVEFLACRACAYDGNCRGRSCTAGILSYLNQEATV